MMNNESKDVDSYDSLRIWVPNIRRFLFILTHASRTTTFKFYAELWYDVYRTSVVTYTVEIFKVIHACREDHALIWLDFQ